MGAKCSFQKSEFKHIGAWLASVFRQKVFGVPFSMDSVRVDNTTPRAAIRHGDHHGDGERVSTPFSSRHRAP
jgi:hypothetical protein